MALKNYLNNEGTIQNTMFEVLMNKAIKNRMDRQQEERPKGTFHCSNIIVSPENFCPRKQILDYKNKKPEDISPELRKVFWHGIMIHEKWQQLFKEDSRAEKIEVTHYSKKFHLVGTPDAIINLWGKSYVVEIKSVRTEIFFKMKETTKLLSSAIVQANLYMWLTNIPRAIILAENKNSHELKVLFKEFEPELIYKYLEQHLIVLDYLERKVLPKCSCKDSSDVRTKRCPHYQKYCFKGGN